MDVALGGRLIQTGQGDDLAQPEILLAAAERLEDLHRLFEGLDKQCRPRPFHKVLLPPSYVEATPRIYALQYDTQYCKAIPARYLRRLSTSDPAGSFG